ncbi:MAG: YncE family protein [Acidobacteriota bacterium]
MIRSHIRPAFLHNQKWRKLSACADSKISCFQGAQSNRLRHPACASLIISTIFFAIIAAPLVTAFGQTVDPFATRKKIVSQGIVVEFELEPADPSRKSADLKEGDDITFRFKLSDEATGTPMQKAYPAAWVSLRREGDSLDCGKKIANFIGGGLTARADLDLNAYYVLALNHDSTISVVDPLFDFGGSKLLALVALKSAGEDWAITYDQSRLFVSMPDSNQVAVIDTVLWKVRDNLDTGPNPTRLALQPDEQYLWATCDSSVAVINTSTSKVVARIPAGKGQHEIAFSGDNRFAFVTNSADGTVSVIDIKTLAKIKDIPVRGTPLSAASSNVSKFIYVANREGAITAIDWAGNPVAVAQAEAGLTQIRVSPNGRWAFAVNTEKNAVFILDVPTTRVIHRVEVEKEPDQIAFSYTLAYVRHKASEHVFMIPLDQIGEGKSPHPADFPGGQAVLGRAKRPSIADGIIQAPGANAVLVANPADKAIYYYKEGMAAPMGSFNNYGREPRAAMVVDRSLKERSPGVYSTTARLPRAGRYDVSFFLDSPRILHCFGLVVNVDDLAQADKLVEIESLIKERAIKVDKAVSLRFKLSDPRTRAPKNDLKDVEVLVFLAPGIWQYRKLAHGVGEGVYEISFTPPRAGVYYVFAQCSSLGARFNQSSYVMLEAQEERAAVKQ